MAIKTAAQNKRINNTVVSVAAALLLGALAPMAQATQQADAGGHSGHGGMNHQATMAQMDEVQVMGMVKKVYAGKPMIKLQHDPVPAWNWPTMTMNFVVADNVDLSGYDKGQSVHFTLKKKADGSYVITEMMTMGNPAMQHGMPGMKH